MAEVGAIEGVPETALCASDLDAADRFYGDVLGLERIGRVYGRNRFFRCGHGVLLIFNPDEPLTPAGDPALPVPLHGTTGPRHACFRMSRDKLTSPREGLAADGVMIESEITWPTGAIVLLSRPGRQQPGMRRTGPLVHRLN